MLRNVEVSQLLNVLFLCTGNSARSILAESTLNALGRGRFRAFSAGSHPGGTVNPLALELLARNGFTTAGARSKSWDEFAGADTPAMDLIITVCDSAAGEVCPVWPGHPLSAHWGVPDPAAVEGSIEAKRGAFVDAFTALKRRIELLVALPADRLDRQSLQAKVREIGRQ